MVVGPDFVYIGIPRTATNTMSRLFLPQFGGVSDGKDHNYRIPPGHGHKFTFVVVRNPYDRLLSMWYHNRHHSSDPEFRTIGFVPFVDMLMTNWDEMGGNQCQIFDLIGRVDSYLRYEDLAGAVLTLPFNRGGISWPTERINSEDRSFWKQDLEQHPEYVLMVERHSRPDFECFGYPLYDDSQC